MTARSTESMMSYQGTLLFRTPAELEAALSLARQRLDEDSDDIHRHAWTRGMLRKGATLTVRVTGSAAAGQRFTAAAALDRLAEHALEGGIEVRQGAAMIDFFAPKARPMAA